MRTLPPSPPRNGRALHAWFVAVSVLLTACGGTSGSGNGGTTAQSADLSALVVSAGALVPAFAPATTDYVVDGANNTTTTVTPTASTPGAAITVNGTAVASGTPSSALPLTAGPNPIQIAVTTPDSTTKTYTVVVMRAAADDIVYLKTSDVQPEAEFGTSVAIEGDTLVVGAPGADFGVGAAYVYVRSGGVWSFQARLQAAVQDFLGSDAFGFSVALSGNTIVVGAWTEDSGLTGVNPDASDNSATDSGAAYVFVRSGAVWTQQAYLKASNTGPNDRFGRRVAVSGDTLVVGAFGEDSGTGAQGDDSALDAGAAYVFTRAGTVWSQEAYLKATNIEAGDSFGSDVGLSGDTLVVAAPMEDGAGNAIPDSGAAYVFVRSGGVWSSQAFLKASNAGATDVFGSSIALQGDTIVVGALQEDSSATGVNGSGADTATDSGAAYVFFRTGAAWSEQAYLKPSNTGADDQFGYSVAVSGDSVVVGARREDSAATGRNGDGSDNSASGAGAAYVFLRSGAAWSQSLYVKASNTAAGDGFGTSAGVSGTSVLVGAPFEGGFAGAAYVYP